MKKSLQTFAITAVAVLGLTSCSPQQRTESQANADQAADKTKDAMSNTADKTKDAASPATDSGKEAANKTGQTLDNAGLTTKVKTKLAADVKLATITSIDVDSSGSTVTLIGHVPTKADKQLAEKVAKSVDGVSKVVDKLTIAP